MRVAFHFDANRFGSSYGFPIAKLLFVELCRCIPPDRRNLFIRRGDLFAWEFARGAGGFGALARRVLECARPIWSSLTEPELATAYAERDVRVLAVEGLALPDAVAVDHRLRQNSGYLGAVEIYLANPAHWVLYDRKLVAAYRIYENDLRLLATSEALDPEGRPEGPFRDWTGSGMFRQVEWEDMGLRDTVLDELSSFERAKRAAEIEDRLDSMGPVVGAVLMRIDVLNPMLSDALHAALQALDRAESEEQLAQASFSCRRFIGQLADAVYRGRATPVKGRKVGPQEYRNRLWAYIEESCAGDEQLRVHGTLQELGDRLDALDERAQKHIHGSGFDRADVNMLILKLTVWTFDVLTLTPPPKQANLAPYRPALDAFVKALVDGHRRRVQ